MKTLLYLVIAMLGGAVMVWSVHTNSPAGLMFGAVAMVLGGILCALEVGRWCRL